MIKYRDSSGVIHFTKTSEDKDKFNIYSQIDILEKKIISLEKRITNLEKQKSKEGLEKI